MPFADAQADAARQRTATLNAHPPRPTLKAHERSSLRPRSRPGRRRPERRRRARRHDAPGPARRRARLQALLGRRAPQHPVGRVDRARGADRAHRGQHRAHPRRLGRRDAAQPRAAGGRRALRHARGAAPPPHRPRPRPRARHRPAHRAGAAQHVARALRGAVRAAARPSRQRLRRHARGRRRAHACPSCGCSARPTAARGSPPSSACRSSSPTTSTRTSPSRRSSSTARCSSRPSCSPRRASIVAAGIVVGDDDEDALRRALPGGVVDAAPAPGPARADPERRGRRGARRGSWGRASWRSCRTRSAGRSSAAPQTVHARAARPRRADRHRRAHADLAGRRRRPAHRGRSSGSPRRSSSTPQAGVARPQRPSVARAVLGVDGAALLVVVGGAVVARRRAGRPRRPPAGRSRRRARLVARGPAAHRRRSSCAVAGLVDPAGRPAGAGSGRRPGRPGWPAVVVRPRGAP